MSLSFRDAEALVGHPPIPATQAGGGCLVLFGIPFAAVGVGALLLAVRGLPIEGHGPEPPPPRLFATLGLVFAAAGVGIILKGLAGLIRARRSRRRQEEFPLEPWRWDYPWDPSGTRAGGLGAPLRSLVSFVFVAAFLSIFHMWLMTAEERPIPVIAILAIFDLVAVIVLVNGVYELFQYLKYGSSRLSFRHFPFRPGHFVEAGLLASRKIARAEKVVLTLRYIVEVTGKTRTSDDDSPSQALYCLQKVTQELNAGQFDAGSDSEIPVRLKLPSGDVSNQLLSSPRRYWELEVSAQTPGVDYTARFLIPVYGAQQTQTMS